MTTGLYNISKYTRYNLSESQSDITVFIKNFTTRVQDQLKAEEQNQYRCRFVSFADEFKYEKDEDWLNDNYDRFFKDTQNETLVSLDYLSPCGFIISMVHTPNGEYIVTGHSTGMIQATDKPKRWYPMFYKPVRTKKHPEWIIENYDRFFKGTQNAYSHSRWFISEVGAITSLSYTPKGSFVVAGHSSGLIQLRHGSTGVVLCTLRNIQFPPRPIYALEFSKNDENVCYAACMDGTVYKIDIPKITDTTKNPPAYCIRADPALESLKTQFYGGPGISSYCTPFVDQRSPAQGLSIFSDDTKMVVGYGDASIKIFDMETSQLVHTYKVHKLRLPYIPKKLQRMHSGQIAALRTHHGRPTVFASAGWDNTARVWDIRCPVGCVITFEGVNIVSDSIDMNRDHIITGSWQPTEALCLWDLVARRRLAVIRAQNRRFDVDGEYIYSCRYWRSADYNRKGKYAIIGGSGTSCVEVINLHNRYITCSYPCLGNVLAITSYGDRIAFGGTATIFHIVKFHDPKHEKDKYEPYIEPEYDYTCKNVTTYSDESEEELDNMNVEYLEQMEQESQPEEKEIDDKIEKEKDSYDKNDGDSQGVDKSEGSEEQSEREKAKDGSEKISN